MPRASRDFQVFVKPVGALCNLACGYCYYRERAEPGPGGRASRMSADLLERYIAGHLHSHPGPVVRFSWHGGEPTLLGLEGFRTAVALQKKHRPRDVRVFNGIQTNGTLLDDEWGRFLAGEGFSVGLSLDGPRRFHDLFRASADGRPSFDAAMRGYEVLRRHRVPTDILCVVHARNAVSPLEIYGFFKEIEAPYVSFLPLVEESPDRPGQAGPESVSADDWGKFLCAAFDEWVSGDIGRIKVQIFEEAARTGFGQEHSLCLFRPECGDIPVVERDGEVYSCDHFTDAGHRLGNISVDSLSALIEGPAQRAFGRAKREALPRVCRSCEVLAMCNGECPKNRFLRAPDGEPGLNYLCAGYKSFFRRCRPWVDAVGAEWRRQNRPPRAGSAARPGRNDPCPCGSGRKFKKCCGAG